MELAFVNHLYRKIRLFEQANLFTFDAFMNVNPRTMSVIVIPTNIMEITDTHIDVAGYVMKTIRELIIARMPVDIQHNDDTEEYSPLLEDAAKIFALMLNPTLLQKNYDTLMSGQFNIEFVDSYYFSTFCDEIIYMNANHIELSKVGKVLSDLLMGKAMFNSLYLAPSHIEDAQEVYGAIIHDCDSGSEYFTCGGSYSRKKINPYMYPRMYKTDMNSDPLGIKYHVFQHGSPEDILQMLTEVVKSAYPRDFPEGFIYYPIIGRKLPPLEHIFNETYFINYYPIWAIALCHLDMDPSYLISLVKPKFPGKQRCVLSNHDFDTLCKIMRMRGDIIMSVEKYGHHRYNVLLALPSNPYEHFESVFAARDSMVPRDFFQYIIHPCDSHYIPLSPELVRKFNTADDDFCFAVLKELHHINVLGMTLEKKFIPEILAIIIKMYLYIP